MIAETPDVLTCADFEGACCDGCHEDDDLEVFLDADAVVARVCCAKSDAARKQLGIPEPARIATMSAFR